MISVKDSLGYFFHSFFPIFNRNVLTPKDRKLSSDNTIWSQKPSTRIYVDGSNLIMYLYPLYARRRQRFATRAVGWSAFCVGMASQPF